MHHEYDKHADRRLILGPVIKYAAIGFTISVVFITGTVTLERKVNTFEQDISQLKAQLASKNSETPDNTATAGESHTRARAEAIDAGASTITASSSNKPVTNTTFIVKDPAVDNDNRDIPVVDAPRADDMQPAVVAASKIDNVVVAEPLATVARKPVDKFPVESQHLAVNRPDRVQQLNSAEAHETTTPAISDTEENQTAAVRDLEYFDFERLNHSDWVELQRLRYEHWLEEIELRHEHKFETRKTSHPGYYMDTYDDRDESM